MTAETSECPIYCSRSPADIGRLSGRYYNETVSALHNTALQLSTRPETMPLYNLRLLPLTLERSSLLAQLEAEEKHALECAQIAYEEERERVEDEWRRGRDRVRERLLEGIEERRRRAREEKDGEGTIGGASIHSKSHAPHKLNFAFFLSYFQMQPSTHNPDPTLPANSVIKWAPHRLPHLSVHRGLPSRMGPGSSTACPTPPDHFSTPTPSPSTTFRLHFPLPSPQPCSQTAVPQIVAVEEGAPAPVEDGGRKAAARTKVRQLAGWGRAWLCSPVRETQKSRAIWLRSRGAIRGGGRLLLRLERLSYDCLVIWLVT